MTGSKFSKRADMPLVMHGSLVSNGPGRSVGLGIVGPEKMIQLPGRMLT